MIIRNAGSIPLNEQAQGTVPDVSGALQSYYQPMVFEPVQKTITGYQIVETGNPINFRGVIQPLSGRQLMMKPEGERSWNWSLLHCDTALTLSPDDVVYFRGKPTRVMTQKPFGLYGFYVYELVQDWEGGTV